LHKIVLSEKKLKFEFFLKKTNIKGQKKKQQKRMFIPQYEMQSFFIKNKRINIILTKNNFFCNNFFIKF